MVGRKLKLLLLSGTATLHDLKTIKFIGLGTERSEDLLLFFNPDDFEDDGGNGFDSWCEMQGYTDKEITAAENAIEKELGVSPYETNDWQIMVSGLDTDNKRCFVDLCTGEDIISKINFSPYLGDLATADAINQAYQKFGTKVFIIE